MDFTNELLAELRGGKSVEDLAKELTKAINTASQENERIKAEEEAKRKKAQETERIAEDKTNAVLSMLDAVIDICVAWEICPDLVKELREMDEDEVDEIVQETDKLIPTFKLYGEIISQLREPRPESDTAPAADPIESFLDKFVR